MSIEDYPHEVLMEYKRLWEEGTLHEANSNNRDAIECYIRMMKITEPDPVVFNRIAYCHLMLNDVEMAMRRLRQSLELDSENVEALHNLSMLLIDHGELSEAEELTRRGIALETNHPGHWKNLGEIKYKQGNYQQAVQALATSIGLAPDNYDTHHKLALAYIRVCDSDNAHREFLRAIELSDDDGELLTDYALLFFVQDRHPEAEPYLRRAVEVDSIRTMPHYMLAHCLLEQVSLTGDDYEEDMIQEVIDLLNKTLELDVLCGEAWYLWGRLMVMFRDWETAEKYLRAGIEHGTAHPECWALHSLALSKLGREDEAEEVFEEFKRRERKMNGIE
ncbi:MAG: tetratricopeptide repeat protein [Candidatus Thorarchaeota archaeon]|nr:MAG: tetratricopeptide repeat protein [Candidatus Thorarchaeota archaeon]